MPEVGSSVACGGNRGFPGTGISSNAHNTCISNRYTTPHVSGVKINIKMNGRVIQCLSTVILLIERS